MISLTVDKPKPIPLDVLPSGEVSLKAETVANPYRGDYEATPTEDVQVFATGGKNMTQDFTVAPIPSNYGRITWDGSRLMVS